MKFIDKIIRRRKNMKEINALRQELEELEKRMHGLGCDRCLHREENSPVCNTIIHHPEKFFSCGFCCERGEVIT